MGNSFVRNLLLGDDSLRSNTITDAPLRNAGAMACDHFGIRQDESYQVLKPSNNTALRLDNTSSVMIDVMIRMKSLLRRGVYRARVFQMAS